MYIETSIFLIFYNKQTIKLCLVLFKLLFYLKHPVIKFIHKQKRMSNKMNFIRKKVIIYIIRNTFVGSYIRIIPLTYP